MHSIDDLNARLNAAVARLLPGAGAVADLRAVIGGASQQTWAFDAQTPAGRMPLILRRQPPGSAVPAGAIALEVEAQVLARVACAGVPAPWLAGVLQPDDGLGEGYLMQRVEGEANSRRILRDARFAAARGRLAWECGAALARIHAVDTATLPPLPLRCARETFDYYRREHDRIGTPRPVLELAFAWLAEHMPPPPGRSALVHGDFRNGNVMVSERGLNAVLDWELAHLGDPMEDLGWMCVNSWRYGHELPVGGFGAREQLFEGYQAGGGRVERERVRYWEVMGTLKWGVICESMADSFRSGDVRTVERAAVGRRASEAEIDLLCLLCEEGV